MKSDRGIPVFTRGPSAEPNPAIKVIRPMPRHIVRTNEIDMRTVLPTRIVRGFTLVELLVVIGIIALLIAMLMPALNKARAQALMVQCMSNHRQLLLAMVQYVNDSKGKICPQYIDNDPSPQAGIKPWYTHRFLGKYIGNKADALPPIATTRNDARTSICSALPGVDHDRLGIGMNACWDNGFLVTTMAGKPISYSRIRQSASTIMFVDVKHRATTGNPTSYLFEQFHQSDASPRSWTGSGRVVAYRHAKKTVVSFADGHAESFTSNYEDWENTQFNQGLHKAMLEGRVKYKRE